MKLKLVTGEASPHPRDGFATPDLAGRRKRISVIVVILLVGVAVRVPFAFAALSQQGLSWHSGGEMFSVASSITAGRGFGSPYWADTGPTAQQTPLFPYLIAALYYVGGRSTEFALRAIATLNIIFSALTCLPAIGIGNKLRRGYGLWFGLGWALSPVLGFSDVVYFWDTAIYTLVLTSLLLYLIVVVENARFRNYFVWGVATGLTLLLSAAHVILIGAILLSLLCARRVKSSQVAITGLAIVSVIAPWVIRNNVVVGFPTFIRSNVGYEVYRGLSFAPEEGLRAQTLNPGRNPAQLALYKKLGEHRYMALQSKMAREFLAKNTAHALYRIGLRAITFWSGSPEIEWRASWIYDLLGVGRRTRHILFSLPAVMAVIGFFLLVRARADRTTILICAATLIVFPLPYYVALTQPRYRAPIEPFLVTLSVYSVLILAQRTKWIFGPAVSVLARRARAATR